MNNMAIDTPKEEKVFTHRDFLKSIYNLLQGEPFFGYVSRELTKTPCETIPTAGVMFNEDTLEYELFYNPKWLGKLSWKHLRFILMHEIYHVIFGHCDERNFDSFSEFDLTKEEVNICMDAAINSLPNMIDNAPDFGVVPGKREFSDWLPGLSTDEYVRLYSKEKKGGKKRGKSNDSLDSPGLPQDSNFDSHQDLGKQNNNKSGARELAKNILRKKVAKAARKSDFGEMTNRSKEIGWGSVSHEIRKEIKRICINEYKISSEELFKNFCSGSIKNNKKTSVTRISRRMPGKKFGKRYKKIARLLIGVDMSASVGFEPLLKLWGWLNDITENVSVTIAPFDTKVLEKEVFVWERGEKKEFVRVLQGGTNFDAPTIYVNENDFDGLAIYTDMEAPKPIECNVQRIWLTTKEGKNNVQFSTHEPILVLDDE